MGWVGLDWIMCVCLGAESIEISPILDHRVGTSTLIEAFPLHGFRTGLVWLGWCVCVCANIGGWWEVVGVVASCMLCAGAGAGLGWVGVGVCLVWHLVCCGLGVLLVGG